ncbi:hypothetical protein JAAARDRAFT_34592 [Jaapia argillacea MUCL 33604]|uniref:Methyltransferase domain-containing protein n=1 Tax=Jaapia argillacea MUCL 33604 TaxID=933084 RepID=A0A067PVH7_9AGAM|nr:hypothetical protein JAAARDRAFT_34592 [Jaapia argillacea MUCL 33604]
MLDTQAPLDLKIVHGRGMNSRSEVYKLPADSPEMERLTLQHRLWKLMEGDLYPSEVAPQVERLLRPKDGQRRSVLDLGSGSGVWAAEIAKSFPSVEVVGFDLVRNANIIVPQNCRFVIGDITTGLSQFEGQFDLIHCRAVIGHLMKPREAIVTISKCLKPGGMLIFADGDIHVLDEHKEAARSATIGEDNHGKSWFGRWMAEWCKQTCADGQYCMEDRVGWLREDTQFEQVEYWKYLSPIGWDGDGIRNGEEIGKIMTRNTVAFTRACKPNFLAAGYPPDVVETWISQIDEEANGKASRVYCVWHAAVAFKRT